ncbi:MAG TPA: AbrB/MazE/SpoVT family DNA-binding domain-containing protein [Polyangiaceae bacterium]|nr:AbrB/MazE/SpoVT family DNA-binding domain-containing protein [Polyangiaceae bacterium]
MTSKLQVTLPKALADEYKIRPGDEILWVASGDSIRVVPAARKRTSASDVAAKLHLFDRATERQELRQGSAPAGRTKGRGWKREDLYDRGRTR